jgi:hypothetical protein
MTKSNLMEINFSANRKKVIHIFNKGVIYGVIAIFINTSLGIILPLVTIPEAVTIGLVIAYMISIVPAVYFSFLFPLIFLPKVIMKLTIEDDKIFFSTYDWFPYLSSKEYLIKIENITSMNFEKRRDPFKRQLIFEVALKEKNKKFYLLGKDMEIDQIFRTINELKTK